MATESEKMPDASEEKKSRSIFDNPLSVNWDIVQKVKETSDDPNETGFDRVRKSWNNFVNGRKSIEFETIMDTMWLGVICGFGVGGFSNRHQAMDSYRRKFNENVYRGQYHANRMLADHMYITFAKQGFQYAVRSGLFTATFMAPFILLATYRNDLYYRDGIISGILCGSSWKAHLGLRAIAVNAGVGALFGLALTGIVRASMTAMGTTFREMRLYHQLENEIEE